jgi:hypothetical protein
MRAIGFLIVLAGLFASPMGQAAPDAVRIEEGVAASVRETLNRAVPALLRLYAALLDAEPRDPPAVAVAWRNRTEIERAVEAEQTAPGPVQVTLSGRDWADPPPEALAALREAVARELARTWNAGIYRPDSGVPLWVTEGNAELMGTAALLRLGLATPGDAARRINVAFNACFAFAGGRPWAAVAAGDSTSVARACGLALQFVLVGFWRGLWKAHPRYSARSIAEHVAATAPGDAAEFAASVLAASPAPIDASLVRGIRSALGVELPNAPPHIYASQTLGNLMRYDCNGASGFWTNNDHLYTDAVAGCKFFKAGWKLRYMAGRDLMTAPLEAVREAKAACARDHTLVFRTLDQQELKMPCDDAAAAALPSDLRVANLQPLRVARVLIRQ